MTTEQDLSTHKQCWICLSEDDQDRREKWVRPCQCLGSLYYVHEKCLLSWITEKEKDGDSQVLCPQCRTPYKIYQPSSPTWFNSISYLERTYTRSMPLLLWGGVGLGVWSAALVHGATSVLLLLGKKEGWRVLNAKENSMRCLFGLPLIPVGLIISQVESLNGIMPLVPFLFLGSPNEQISLPPSPSVTVCLLPWIRILYNSLFKSIFESQLKEIKQAEKTNGDSNLDRDDPDIVQIELGSSAIESIALPAISFACGRIVSLFNIVKDSLPMVFHRNVLGGCMFIVLKDLVGIAYRLQKVRIKKCRRILEYQDN